MWWGRRPPSAVLLRRTGPACLWGVWPLYFRGRDARSSQARGPRHYLSDMFLKVEPASFCRDKKIRDHVFSCRDDSATDSPRERILLSTGRFSADFAVTVLSRFAEPGRSGASSQRIVS